MAIIEYLTNRLSQVKSTLPIQLITFLLPMVLLYSSLLNSLRFSFMGVLAFAQLVAFPPAYILCYFIVSFRYYLLFLKLISLNLLFYFQDFL